MCGALSPTAVATPALPSPPTRPGPASRRRFSSPASTSEKKVAQLRGYGATVHCVNGSRADAASAASEHVAATGAFYASHVYNPLFHHGTKTFAFELWEQLGFRLPGTVVLPAGNGTLLIGASIGFQELAAAGMVEHVPRLVAVQAERSRPWRRPGARCPPRRGRGRHAAGPAPVPAGAAPGTVATAARACHRRARPAGANARGRGRQRRDRPHGDRTRDSLGPPGPAAKGIDVEPTAATTYAAWLEWPEAPAPSSTVLAMTGAGLKSPPPSRRAAVAPQPGEGHEK